MEMISSLEILARTKMEDYRLSSEWTVGRQSILIAFKAAWSSSLTVEQIMAIVAALASPVTESELKAALSKAVRAKLLRRANQRYELTI